MAASDGARGTGSVAGRVERAAPAKLNLFLKVVGRRADGYHLLDSLVAFASVGDRVGVAPAPNLALTVAGRFADAVPADAEAEDNLVLRAARMLADTLGRMPDVAVELEKSLPVAAGIGGGSADAAATLRALAVLWGIGEDDPRLSGLAARLGADVPVCLVSRTSRMRGVGDDIGPAPSLAGRPVLLVNPGVPVATPDVFRAFAGPFSSAVEDTGPAHGQPLLGWISDHGNDLQEPATRIAPVIGDVVAAIGAEHGCRLARMSGSGATCFGLFDTDEACRSAASNIQSRQPDWWVAAGRIL